MVEALETCEATIPTSCLTDPEGHFRTTYGQCLDADLNEEEQVLQASVFKILVLNSMRHMRANLNCVHTPFQDLVRENGSGVDKLCNIWVSL